MHDSQPDQPDMAQSMRADWRTLGILLVLVFALHLPSLFNPFFIDDYVYLETADQLTWSTIPDVFLSSTMDEHASSVWWTPLWLYPA